MSEYEFNEEENQLFESVSGKMIQLSVMAVISGILSLIIFFIIGFKLFFILTAISTIVFGLFFYLPVDNFRRIISIEEYDISELVQGYRELNTGWQIVLVVVILSIINSIFEVILNV